MNARTKECQNWSQDASQKQSRSPTARSNTGGTRDLGSRRMCGSIRGGPVAFRLARLISANPGAVLSNCRAIDRRGRILEYPVALWFFGDPCRSPEPQLLPLWFRVCLSETLAGEDQRCPTPNLMRCPDVAPLLSEVNGMDRGVIMHGSLSHVHLILLSQLLWIRLRKS